MNPILQHEPISWANTSNENKRPSSLEDKVQSVVQTIILKEGNLNYNKIRKEWNTLTFQDRALIYNSVLETILTKKYHLPIGVIPLSRFQNEDEIDFIDNAIYAALIVHIHLLKDAPNGIRFLDQIGVEITTLRGKLARTLIVLTNENPLLNYLSMYQIYDERLYSEIYKILIECKKFYHVSFSIKSSLIWDQKYLVEIAKLAAKSSQENISLCIQNFNIWEVSSKIEIAKIAATTDPDKVSQNITNYRFVDKRAIIEVAKVVASQKSGRISKYIENYKIEDQRDLIKIAKLEAKNGLYGPSEHIENYKIEDQTALIKIAKIAAKHNGAHLAKYIKNYKITDTKELFKIAKIAAKNSKIAIECDGKDVSLAIANFKLRNSQKRIKVARLASINYPFGTMKNLNEYRIKDQQILIEIVKNFALLNCNVVSNHIDTYGIKEEIDRIEIAKIAAINSPENTLHFIRKYKINNIPALTEIAKLIAKSSTAQISLYIKNFPIKDSNALFKIAKVAVIHNPDLTLLCLNQYSITDQNKLNYLYRIGLFQNPLFDYMLLERKGILSLEFASLLNQILSMFNNNIGRAFDKRDLEFMKVTFKRTSDNDQTYISEKIIDAVLPRGNLTLQPAREVIGTICQLQLLRDNIGNIRYNQIENCIESIYSLHHPQLKKSLLLYVFDCSEFQACIYKLLCKYYGQSKYQTIPHFLLSVLNQQGIGKISNITNDDEKEEYDPIRTMARSIKKFKSHGNLVYKDAIALQSLLTVLYYLINEKHLSIEDKGKILQYLGTVSLKQDLVLSLNMLIGIKDLNSNLGCFSAVEITLERIKSEFKTAIEGASGSFDIEEFSEKFERDFGKFRSSYALYSYIGKMKNLPPNQNQEMMIAVRTFISEVIEGTHHESRYLNSIHLEEIFNKMPSLKSEWKKSFVEKLELNDRHESFIDFDIKTHLSISLRQNHDEGQLDFLQEFLTTEKCPDEKLDTFSQALLVLTTCINPDKIEKQLQRCIDLAPENIQATQFMQDLRDWKKMVDPKTQKMDTEGWTIVNTDHPWDLFLCGTEVLGSCQSVNGSPELNKCLLGYVLDGKNRLIAIKDNTGKIQARAILRLLLTQQEEPALFLERIYPSTISTSHRDALVEFARKSAKSLGLPLYSLEVKGDKNCNVQMISKSCRAPYEYVDAGNGLKIKGIWDCKASELLYAPPSGG